MENQKIKITNSKQFEKLVEEMEKNPPIARGFRRGTVPNDFKEQWESVSIMLNALGPPKRSGDGWQKVWRDLKCKVKRKLVTNKAECNATGGGIFKQLTLSPLEEAVANLLQFQKQLNPEGAFQGVQCQGKNTECELQEIAEEAADSVDFDLSNLLQSPESVSRQLESATTSKGNENINPLKRKRNYTKPTKMPNANDQHELLQKHSIEQARGLADINNSMSSVKRSLRDLSKFHKQLLDIEAKKLELLMGRSEREKEMHKAELKIKAIKFAIKEKELQALNNQI